MDNKIRQSCLWRLRFFRLGSEFLSLLIIAWKVCNWTTTETPFEQCRITLHSSSRHLLLPLNSMLIVISGNGTDWKLVRIRKKSKVQTNHDSISTGSLHKSLHWHLELSHCFFLFVNPPLIHESLHYHPCHIIYKQRFRPETKE